MLSSHNNNQRAIAKLLPKATNIKGYFEKKSGYVLMHMSFQLPVKYLREVNELINEGHVITYKKHGIMQKYLTVNVCMKTLSSTLVNDISTNLGSEEIRTGGTTCELKLV